MTKQAVKVEFGTRKFETSHGRKPSSSTYGHWYFDVAGITHVVVGTLTMCKRDMRQIVRTEYAEDAEPGDVIVVEILP